jgi:HEPN domain-containing protein
MNNVSRSWVRKAERDFKVAQGLMRRWEPGYADAACFHCQQAVEKYLKARLIDAGIAFPRTHDLAALLALLLPQDPLWQSFDVACQTLTQFAVNTRYPGDDATKREAVEALKFATAIRREARLALGVKP